MALDVFIGDPFEVKLLNLSINFIADFCPVPGEHCQKIAVSISTQTARGLLGQKRDAIDNNYGRQ